MWSKLWLAGWAVLIGAIVGYEVYGWRDKNRATPTLSTILVRSLPLPVLHIATGALAGVLSWHWWDLKERIDHGEDEII